MNNSQQKAFERKLARELVREYAEFLRAHSFDKVKVI